MYLKMNRSILTSCFRCIPPSSQLNKPLIYLPLFVGLHTSQIISVPRRNTHGRFPQTIRCYSSHHHNSPSQLNYKLLKKKHTNKIPKCSENKFNSISKHPLRTLSTMRQNALLEEFIFSHVNENLNDPILKRPLRDLNWIRGPYVLQNTNSIQVVLRLPTKLHPKLDVLVESIKQCTNEAIQMFNDKQEQTTEQKIDWDVDVQIQITSPQVKIDKGETIEDVEKRLGPGLIHVSKFIAVYSCKGGVGKSTVATNLAYSLARKGGRVGLIDVDVYGPSLPVLISPSDPTVRRSSLGEGMVLPITHEGVKLLSLGFVSPKSGVPGSGGPGSSGAAVMRGPMASRVVSQLLKGTEWGELDVLLLDMPPGTGDVQLTICQDLQLNGSISVTTPSKLAITDAIKGIEMFDSLGVPTLAIIENMAYFECEGGGKHYPFGKGIDSKALLPETNSSHSSTTGHPSIFQLPISEETNSSNDVGVPITLSRPPEAQITLNSFDDIADDVAESLLLQHYNQFNNQPNEKDDTVTSNHPTITIRGEQWNVSSLQLTADMVTEKFIVRLYSDTGAIELNILGEDLRMTHPKSGVQMEDLSASSDIMQPKSSGCGSQDEQHHDHKDNMVQHHKHKNELPNLDRPKRRGRRLFPVVIEKRGYYGYAVEWADGATIIYSMSSIAQAAAKSSSRLESYLG